MKGDISLFLCVLYNVIKPIYKNCLKFGMIKVSKDQNTFILEKGIFAISL